MKGELPGPKGVGERPTSLRAAHRLVQLPLLPSSPCRQLDTPRLDYSTAVLREMQQFSRGDGQRHEEWPTATEEEHKVLGQIVITRYVGNSRFRLPHPACCGTPPKDDPIPKSFYIAPYRIRLWSPSLRDMMG